MIFLGSFGISKDLKGFFEMLWAFLGFFAILFELLPSFANL